MFIVYVTFWTSGTGTDVNNITACVKHLKTIIYLCVFAFVCSVGQHDNEGREILSEVLLGCDDKAALLKYSPVLHSSGFIILYASWEAGQTRHTVAPFMCCLIKSVH